MIANVDAPHRQRGLLSNYSIEMTAKDVANLEQAADVIPQGTKIPVTFLPGETFEMRIAAAKRIRELGFLPIPHISARRLSSQQELEGFLAENWRAGISPTSGNPVYTRPIVLTIRREDHSFLLDPIMRGRGG